ncbi:hypothetical protein BS47DRAFT_1359705 [Hydnum rufescens UP504]|uniref:Uncharacterized protein n=1 Tax=Hydnum rufescens UP504 TaxID=1448309 RepID=A0A9P6B4A5_9AGAM|nr:hypothetical protein BS47DRAFT_1359705 [Hydnum rufescens UP504]
MPASPSGGTKTTIGGQATKSNQAFRTLALFHLEPANCPEVFWRSGKQGLKKPILAIQLGEYGDRVKTPGERFSDTGVMAGVCRHDRVVMWVNMWTPGEQQFYALALIDVIMAELPMHCILKWNLLPRWIPRIVFGISVFHGYCHQWVCQLWYNPQKGGVWGLTDGEGCEHLWNDLQRLIPNLRVTGFHRRLFVLDLQIEHLDHLKMQQAGVWLEKRVKAMKAHLIIAQEKRARIPLSDEFLQSQFEEQQAYQSQPLEQQSKKKGFLAVEKILGTIQSVTHGALFKGVPASI